MSEALAAVVARALPGSVLSGSRPLTGGVSAAVSALNLDGADGQPRTVVLRQQQPMAGKSADLDRASNEFALLSALWDSPIPVPRMLYLDTTCDLLPGPYALMEFVDGSTDVAKDRLDAALDTMADTLAAIHRQPVAGLPTLPARLDPRPEVFDFLAVDEWPELCARLTDFEDTAYHGPRVLLHGDFWPGNLLWRDGRLVAVVDWEDCALGDPMVDLAGARLELTWRYGTAAADRLTRRYAGTCPVDDLRLALWEVYVASAGLRYMGYWGLPAEQETARRDGARGVIRRAAAALSITGSL